MASVHRCEYDAWLSKTVVEMHRPGLQIAISAVGWMLLLIGGWGAGTVAFAQDGVSTDSAVVSSFPGSVETSNSFLSTVERSRRGESLFYVAGESAVLYNRSDSTAPVARLPVRTPVQRLECEERWCRIRTDEGREGFVPASVLSNLWIRVSKRTRRVYLYRGAKLTATFEADVSYNSFADKKRSGSPAKRDHWRTPEGTFYVVHKNPESQFYKALVLNYPTVKDARRGLEEGLISQSQYEAIEEAQRELRIPPMNTGLGGWIEIHGDGTGDSTTWTEGCIAVQNRDMNMLWPIVQVGTPVLIE